MRRRWRRRVVVGGMVMLAAGGTAAAIKMSQQDADRIESHTGASVEELTEEELTNAMRELGIQSIELDANDQAIINQGAAPAAQAPTPVAPETPAPQAPAAATGTSMADEIERLADLRDRGIITEDDFVAAKKKLLGL